MVVRNNLIYKNITSAILKNTTRDLIKVSVVNLTATGQKEEPKKKKAE